MAFSISSVVLPVLFTLIGTTAAPERTLVIPQIEGERQGKIIGRAISCGAPADRTDKILRVVRERMLGKLGRAMTDERFVPELNQAIFFETSLPASTDSKVCARALEALDQLEGAD